MKIKINKFEQTPDFYISDFERYIENYLINTNVCPLNITIYGRMYIGKVKKFCLDLGDVKLSDGQKIECFFLELESYSKNEIIYNQVYLEPVTEHQQLRLL
jgi:hypothetical protein